MRDRMEESGEKERWGEGWRGEGEMGKNEVRGKREKEGEREEGKGGEREEGKRRESGEGLRE